MDNKIVIIIGHRLETMHWASTLYVLKHGRIIQQGSYATLPRSRWLFQGPCYPLVWV